jgi:molybdopterin/thiamine biosynthesis adenylyltransferase
LLKVKESRAKPFDGLSFSLYSYRCGDTDVGPPLPERLPLGVLLVGVGAIGNGVIHLLDLLPIDGFVWIVDVQTFQPENLGTCLLIGLPELGKEKAAFAEALLRKKVDARGFSEDLVSFADRLGKKIPYPAITVNALDNIPARHAVQNLWPDMIIDGAIGDFACQVSRHPWGEDVACLRCLFYEPTESADLIASRTSGLSRGRTQQPFERVTDEDVQVAVDGRKEWLRARIGRQICSVVQEAVAEQISQEHQAERFQPSVPFVACLSASMIISELVKHLCGWPTPLAPRFQLDVLRGPKSGEEFPEKRRRDCICVTRKRNIDIFRRTRGHSF